MSYNIGYAVALKTSGNGGGIFTINNIAGGTSPQTNVRGLIQPGNTAGNGSLPIHNPSHPKLSMQYPININFSGDGVAIIPFLYDHGCIPHTVSSPSGILATPFRYTIAGIPDRARVNERGLLLHFSNLANFSRASPHFKTPSIPIPSFQRMINAVTERARLLYSIHNTLSHPMMAGIIIV